jgi:hypothetical protein
MGETNNMKKSKFENNLLAFSGILFIILLLFIIFNSWNILEKKEIPANFIIGERLGFDLNSSALTFGMLPPGASSSRAIEITNDFNREVFVSIYSSRSIIKFTRISENDFYLAPGETRSVSFTVYTEKNSTFGQYNGFIKIIIKKDSGVF